MLPPISQRSGNGPKTGSILSRVSKLIVPKEDEVSPTLASYIDLANIPEKYGGEHGFEHGMQPDLGPAIDEIIDWLAPCSGSFPVGPMKLVSCPIGVRLAVSTGSTNGIQRSFLAGIVHPNRSISTESVNATSDANTM